MSYENKLRTFDSFKNASANQKKENNQTNSWGAGLQEHKTKTSNLHK